MTEEENEDNIDKVNYENLPVNAQENVPEFRKGIKLPNLQWSIALMQVFPKPIVLTTKPRIDAIRSLHI